MVLAVLLFRVGNAGSVSRKLSLLLVVEGVTLISTGYIDLLFTSEISGQAWYPLWLQAEGVIHTAGDCAMLALYPPFLAAALQTRLVKPFGSRNWRIGLLAAAGVLAVSVLMTPLKLGATLLYILLTALFIFALVASINAWWSAKGVARARAGSFAIAFGIRDVCWTFAYGFATWSIWFGEYYVVDTNATGLAYALYALGSLMAVPLIAYGILRTHLFDIDLRIRWTIKQSTLAGLFVALVYLLSEGADRFLSSELGNWAGLIASAIVVFFLAPLQRFAERVASAAMPNTKNTPEYAAYRKMQVYEAAVSEAMLEGGISHKERALLERLRESLEISVVDAISLERDLQSAGFKDLQTA